MLSDKGSAAFWRSLLYSSQRLRKLQTPSVSSQSLDNLTHTRVFRLPTAFLFIYLMLKL